jgi:predicted Zn-dependent protease with MMP-like domain
MYELLLERKTTLNQLEKEQFEQIAQEAFDSLPEVFQTNMENVHIVVEDFPHPETSKKVGVRSGGMLLGLYEGVPLSKRGTWYGMYPALPDKITLYKKNIERVATSERAIREKIREVLIHEIAHHFGMDEEEVRNAGY